VEIPERLRHYIDNIRLPLPPLTDPDEPLRIDSLGFVRLVAFLESDLGVRLADEELVAENFESLRTLGKLLASKSPTTPRPPTYSPIFPSARRLSQPRPFKKN
jgi:acyl carrier protein